MIAYLKTLLRNLPPPVFQLLELPYHHAPPAFRYGEPYRRMLDLYRESDHWTEQQLRQFQEERLRNLTAHAYTNVPYYTQLFDERGLNPADIQTLDDLNKIPVLTSDIVKSRWKDLVARNVSRLNREVSHTSGSTGPSMYFYFDHTTIPVERAQAMRHLLWLGYQEGDKIAVVKGQPLSDPRKIVKYYHGSRELRVSLMNSDDETLATVVDALERMQPSFLRGWPSCLYIIARWMNRNNRRIAAPKFIITSSENLYQYMRSRIEHVFGAKVVDGYGQSEFVAYALQCQLCQGYHVQMETGIMELIPYRGALSEIVGTCLWNFAMPFIRYATGDLAIKQQQPCPCGRKSWLLSEIVGRTADLVYRQEQSDSAYALGQCTFYDLEEIKESQILLEDDNTVNVKVVPRGELSSRTKDLIRCEIEKVLGTSPMTVIIEEVDQVSPLERGKRPLIVGRSPSL